MDPFFCFSSQQSVPTYSTQLFGCAPQHTTGLSHSSSDADRLIHARSVTCRYLSCTFAPPARVAASPRPPTVSFIVPPLLSTPLIAPLTQLSASGSRPRSGRPAFGARPMRESCESLGAKWRWYSTRLLHNKLFRSAGKLFMTIVPRTAFPFHTSTLFFGAPRTLLGKLRNMAVSVFHFFSSILLQ
jgi:hypothetical protein